MGCIQPLPCLARIGALGNNRWGIGASISEVLAEMILLIMSSSQLTHLFHVSPEIPTGLALNDNG